MWIQRFQRIHNATVPRSKGPTPGHGLRRDRPAPVLRSRISVVVVLGLLVLGACVSLAVGIDPYRSIAIGSLAFCGVGLFRAEERTRVALLLLMIVAAIALVVV